MSGLDRSRGRPFRVPVSTAPGYRDAGNNGRLGALKNVGYTGFSWASTPVTDAVTVRCLDFHTQNLDPTGAHNRGHGFQLRCLSE